LPANKYKPRPGTFRVLCFLCVLAVSFAGFVQASHVHSDNSKLTGHDCSMCSVAHSGVLSSAAYEPTPVLLRTIVVVPTTDSVESSDVIFTLHIRPPPAV